MASLREELFRATDGRGVDTACKVRNLNSNLYKLALVDESLAPPSLDKLVFLTPWFNEIFGTHEEQTNCFQRGQRGVIIWMIFLQFFWTWQMYIDKTPNV